MRRLDNKIAVVTGAAQGVGRAIAVRLAAEGATMVLVDRTAALCADAKAAIAELGGGVLALGCDLETQAGAQYVVRSTLEQFGRIDIAVNNVGGAIRAKPFWEYSGEELQAEISRSLWPTLWCCREIIPVMRSQGAGSIVNIGSAATRWMWRAPYSAAKGGVHALTVSLSRELAESGVRINCVAPGAIEVGDRITPRNPAPLSEQEIIWKQWAYDQSLADTPMARAGTANEVAAAVSFLASADASYVTGQILFVAGGAIG